MRGTRRGENAYKRGRFSIKCMIAGAHTKINEILGELRGGRGGGGGLAHGTALTMFRNKL